MANDVEFRLARARRLSRALANKGWTKALLSQKTGYDEKTIRNVFAGESVRDQTVIDISQALDVAPDLESGREHADVADDKYGGYPRSTHKGYEGFFFAYRPSFLEDGKIFKSVVEIRWNDVDRRLDVLEYYELDEDTPGRVRSHEGAVHMSGHTNLAHFLTAFEGSLRLLTLTKLREPEGIMRGAIMTQSESLMFFQPISSAVFLCKLKKYDATNIPSDIGLIDETAGDFVYASDQLALTEQRIVRQAHAPKLTALVAAV